VRKFVVSGSWSSGWDDRKGESLSQLFFGCELSEASLSLTVVAEHWL
jgi:hypothetical protein